MAGLDVVVVGCGIAGLAAAVAAQQGGAHVIVLERAPEDERGGNTRYTGAWLRMKADTLAGLAEQLKIPADALETTVAAYNKACAAGTYNEADMDGLATRGITPRKSNWARPIKAPPYIAYPIIASIVLTFGGLKVTQRAQVVNQQGDVIPGLYAAGETMGLYYRSYTGATSVLKGAVFGRIAGADAAKRRNA